MNKTKVILTQDVHQSEFKKDMIGYIDGYVRGGDGRPYAVVVVGSIIGLVPFFNINVIDES